MRSEPTVRRPAEPDGMKRRRPLTVLALATLLASTAVAVALIAGAVSGKGNRFPAFALGSSGSNSGETEVSLVPATDALDVLADGGQLAPGLSSEAAAELGDELARMVEAAELRGSFAIAVKDMGSGATVSYHAEAMQRSGCLVNFFVLALALRDVADGNLLFQDIEPLVEDIVGFSDAAAAFDLYLLVGDGDLFYGLERVSLFIDEVTGSGQSILDHPPGFEWDSLGLNENNYITASAMNVALASLARGELLPAPWDDYLVDMMANVSPGLDYLLADLPDDVIVSHKNGWFAYDDGNVENDTAIVRYIRDGIPGAYVITFMSDSPDSYTSILLAQAVTHLVYTAVTGTALADPLVAAAAEPTEESAVEESPEGETSPADTHELAAEVPGGPTVEAPPDPSIEPESVPPEGPAPEVVATEEVPSVDSPPDPAVESVLE